MIFVVRGFWSVWVCGYSRRERGDQQEGLDRTDQGVKVLEEVHGGQGEDTEVPDLKQHQPKVK